MTREILCSGCADTIALIADLERLTDANAFDPDTALDALPHLLESALSCLLAESQNATSGSDPASAAIGLLVAAAAQAQALDAARGPRKSARVEEAMRGA